jgi:hypothetical protein
MDEIQELLRNGDSFAAVEYIQRNSMPLEIAAKYKSISSDLYWKAHDLGAMITIGRAGILYCLSQAGSVNISAELVEKLRSVAKGLAYDIGSFTWPGWEEPGIDPTSEQLAVGLDCARLNLRLAIELNKPADRISMAHWLLGAHALVVHDFDFAEKEFQRARDVLPVVDTTAKAMEGYLALSRIGKDKLDAASQARFAEITAGLGGQKDDDGASYFTQLMAARRLFVPA